MKNFSLKWREITIKKITREIFMAVVPQVGIELTKLMITLEN